MTASTDLMKLWLWPWDALHIAGRLTETAVATQSVLGARLPIIADAAANPHRANHCELSLMASEKIDAFSRSAKPLAYAGEIIRQASAANAKALGRAAGGGFISPLEWLAVFERNLTVTVTLAALPANMLAPVHKSVTSNARRLREV